MARKLTFDHRMMLKLKRSMWDEIAKVAGDSSRAEFIRQAIAEHIKRLKRKQDKG